MFDEYRYIERVEAANPEAFAELLVQPSPDEEAALRAWFGDGRYKRLHALALRRASALRRGDEPLGNVVVIHGFLGAGLAALSSTGDETDLWLKLGSLGNGQVTRLRLADDGLSEYESDNEVRVTGILKRYYGELLLTLAETWNVRGFCYDWRKGLDVAANQLQADISGWFDDDAPIHLVAHGLGGLVARTFVANTPTRWRAMWDRGDSIFARAPGEAGGRLVLIGVPNHGAFETVRSLVGGDPTFERLARIALHGDPREFQETYRSWVAPYHLLPFPLEPDGMDQLYEARTYGGGDAVASRLASASQRHAALRDAVDPDRMIGVVGINRPTLDGINDFDNLDRAESYDVTLTGDGWVPARLSLLTAAGKQLIPTYAIDADHGELVTNRRFLSELDDILRTGASSQLAPWSANATPPRLDDRDGDSPRERRTRGDRADEERFVAMLRQTRNRSVAERGVRVAKSSDAPVTDLYSLEDERAIQDELTQGRLCRRDALDSGRKTLPFKPARIRFRLLAGEIEDLDRIDKDRDPGEAVDVIAVGHYLGDRPQTAALALDRSIRSHRSRPAREGANRRSTDDDLLVSELAERGTIRGELGQTFFLTDPRVARGDGPTSRARLLAIAGMGVPGRFGEPELTVLARELCWSLGRMGYRHLATVLIGAGRGNLDVREATLAWIRGIKYAITGSVEDEGRSLRQVTFVARSPSKLRVIQQAVLDEQQRLLNQDRLVIDFEPLPDDEIERYELRWQRAQRAARDETEVTDDDAAEPAPARLAVTLDGQGVYRFGAITESAAIPEREIPIDPSLVAEANEELVAARDLRTQYLRGQFLEQLLLPDEFRAQVYSAAPLVLMLDSTIARIHWELVAQSDFDLLPTFGSASSADDPFQRDGGEFDPRRFIGTSRGVTRQLRSTFAQPPDPPPPPRRVLRVLVIADPAADNRLPGAEAEGAAVATLFEQFNVTHAGSANRVEVATLLGPHEATRTNVLRQLMLRSYDVLHFAGHCVYDHENPLASGWLFSDGKRITAAELNRIDRVPNFVFSNACESGVTPDRAERRSVELGPTFAEAFFARGVTNFVCTAWPVDDIAAQVFAITLYEHLLGMKPMESTRRHYQPVRPAPMHRAMRDARLTIAQTAEGVQTWGAYQHYGTPHMSFFSSASMRNVEAAT
jgi:hypothetical protein